MHRLVTDSGQDVATLLQVQAVCRGNGLTGTLDASLIGRTTGYNLDT